VETRKPRILVLVAQYLPGEMGGGTVQSVIGLVEKLSAIFRFRLVTSAAASLSPESRPIAGWSGRVTRSFTSGQDSPAS
jgi:hypothetical protein